MFRNDRQQAVASELLMQLDREIERYNYATISLTKAIALSKVLMKGYAER
jgi:hypothetical protein